MLPTYGSARFSGALTVDDFLKHVHVVTLDRAAFDAVAPHVIALATAEGLAAHAESIRPARRRADDHRRPRDDVALMDGYHSPQVDVAVRLNTNESPVPPPAGFAERSPRRSPPSTGTATPTGPTARLREAIAAQHGVDARQVFAANGSNEVLQSLCLAYGGAGRTVAVFEPTYALHTHIATLTGTAVARRAERRLHARPRRGAPGPRRGGAGHHVPLLAQQPHRACRGRGRPCATVLDPAPGPAGRRRGLRPVRAVVRARLVDDDRPLVVTRTYSKTWSMAAARLGYLVGPPGLVASSRRWCCRTTSTP